MKTIFTPLANLMLIALLSMGMTAYAQPDNDHITNATDLAWSLGGQLFDQGVAFTEATSTGDGGQQGCGTGVAGIYYKFTATVSGNVAAQIEPASQGIIVFYSAPDPYAETGEELTHVDQPTNPCDNGNIASIVAEAGTTYYIFMKNNIDADVIINASEVFVVPANDQIANATSLNGLEDYFDDNVNMMMATFENDFGQLGCDTGEVRAIWYKFTAQIEGEVVAGIGSDPNASAIIFYEAPDENAVTGEELTWVNQVNNPCAEGTLHSIVAEAGTTYYIMAGTANAYADISVNLSGILGTQDQSLEDFSFYPNPNSGILNIEAISNIEQVSFFNVMGQKVLQIPLEGNKVQVDLSSLTAGFYLAQINSDGKVGTFKIIKN
jgi:Secretion system C-terminal sorting domain